MKKFILDILFIFLITVLVISYAIDITISMTLMCICFVFRLWKWVQNIGFHICDCFETMEEMVVELTEEAEAVLSKNKNCEKSNS